MEEKILQIAVTVNTTHDDKDYDLWWELEILQGDKQLGRIEAGKDDNAKYRTMTWPNGDRRDLVIPLTSPFPFDQRLQLSLRITQHWRAKNFGWEGNVEATAYMDGGQIQRVLLNTGDFKLGENDNPLVRVFDFNA